MALHQDDMCSTKEAADMLGISLRTVQLWVESGVLRAWKTAGGHRRILRTSVEALLLEREKAVADKPVKMEALHLLIVEDEPDLMKLYQLNIEGWHLPVTLHTAVNGFEGLIRIGEVKPDILITDLNMPGMDGFRMLRVLRGNVEFADMEIIVVTALGRDEITDRGGLPSGVRIFTKPVPFSELERLVRERIGHRASGLQGKLETGKASSPAG